MGVEKVDKDVEKEKEGIYYPHLIHFQKEKDVEKENAKEKAKEKLEKAILMSM